MAYEKLSSQEEEFVIKILYKESTHLIRELKLDSTIGELKSRVASLINIPENRQRLIFSGKSLSPDSALLSSFHIANNSVVHVFPLPPSVPHATPLAPSNTSSTVPRIISPFVAPFHPPNSSPYSDPASRGGEVGGIGVEQLVQETGEPVKVWSMVLVFTSTITLFNYLIGLLALGTVGNNVFDGCVNTLEAACSLAGVYVGQMGIDVATQMSVNGIPGSDYQRLERYVKLLLVVGIASILTRCVWVVDVILEAEYVVHSQNNNDNNNDHSNSPSTGKSDPGSFPDLTQSDMFAFTVQALIIASFFVVAWLSCLYRAVRFRNVVTAHDSRLNTAVPVSDATVLAV